MSNPQWHKPQKWKECSITTLPSNWSRNSSCTSWWVATCSLITHYLSSMFVTRSSVSSWPTSPSTTRWLPSSLLAKPSSLSSETLIIMRNRILSLLLGTSSRAFPKWMCRVFHSSIMIWSNQSMLRLMERMRLILLLSSQPSSPPTSWPDWVELKMSTWTPF